MPDIFIDKDPEENVEEESAIEQADSNLHPAKEEDTSHKTHKDTTKKNEVQNDIEEELPGEAMSRSELIQSLGIKSHGGKIHAFSSYFETPERVHFANKLNEEIMLLFLRRHFLTNLPWILKAFAMALIPLIFEFLGAFGFYSTDFVAITGKFIIYFFYYFFIFSGYILVNYMTWFYNISLVTNIRVIDIDFSDIVFEDVAATKISQLEDVNYKQVGIVRSVFDYGDVFVQTAGTQRNFEFLAVPHPENVIRIINNLLGRKRRV